MLAFVLVPNAVLASFAYQGLVEDTVAYLGPDDAKIGGYGRTRGTPHDAKGVRA